MIRVISLVVLTLLYFFYTKYGFEMLTELSLSKQEEFLLILLGASFANNIMKD